MVGVSEIVFVVAGGCHVTTSIASITTVMISLAINYVIHSRS